MEVHRAPIQQQEIVIGGDANTSNRPRTRFGYLVPEAYAYYEQALGESGAVASGKVLHFAADLICSGGLDIWIRGAYSYAIQKIGLSSPRIFVYLRQRCAELDKKQEQLPQEAFYSHPDVQSIVSEVVLVLQIAPRRAKIAWPKIDENAKRPGWLRGVAGAPETAAVKRVWTSDGDTAPLYLVGNELCKAISEGATERALFWIRWVIEEDARVRKETKGHGLSTRDRGPPTASPKSRTEAGHYCADLLREVYRELAAKQLVRMHEEFTELWNLWRGSEKRMPARLRRDCLGIMTQICCEVPKWKVPAAPALVGDPVRLSRAVGQAGMFFREVLSCPALPPEKNLKPKMMKGERQKKTKVASEKEERQMSLDEHLSAYDAAMEAYLKKF
jgi:hypothetical protein